MGYWIPIGKGNRVFKSNLKDAYLTAAKTLLELYRHTNGNITWEVAGYTDSFGLPIYNSSTGKAANHWIRFHNGSDPKNGYDECTYNSRIGMISKEGKPFPKNW